MWLNTLKGAHSKLGNSHIHTLKVFYKVFAKEKPMVWSIKLLFSNKIIVATAC